jgi:hypothetical protein
MSLSNTMGFPFALGLRRLKRSFSFHSVLALWRVFALVHGAKKQLLIRFYQLIRFIKRFINFIY